jgi:hypothetical protein
MRMKKSVLVVFLLLSGATGAQEARLKPGLWEVKIVRQVVDGRDMTSQMASAQEKVRQAMANLSPEQRKQMEAMMGGRGMPAMGSDGANRICVSAAMAARDNTVADPQGRCAPTKIERSGATTSFEFNCSNNGRTSAGKGKSTVSADAVATSVDATTTDAKGQHTMHSETQMTFLGADCQGIKPAEEIAKSMGAAPH